MLSRRHRRSDAPSPPVAEPDPRLRDEPDADPLVEEMTARLRAGLGSLEATDQYGRPMAWRNVVRLAVGPALTRLRDADTAAVLWDAVAEQSAGSAPSADQCGQPSAADPVGVVPPEPAPVQQFDQRLDLTVHEAPHSGSDPLNSPLGWPRL